LAIARKKNVNYVWLGVWELNQKAISFYTKNGFVAFSAHSFWLGDDEQTDIMMKRMPG
jgi:ribosomal protein S18 acetylase RimI-like enzyme